jgi:hypothetical protein
MPDKPSTKRLGTHDEIGRLFGDPEYQQAVEAYFRGLPRYRNSGSWGKLCEECHKFRADPPSKLCPACEAYSEHQR